MEGLAAVLVSSTIWSTPEVFAILPLAPLLGVTPLPTPHPSTPLLSLLASSPCSSACPRMYASKLHKGMS